MPLKKLPFRVHRSFADAEQAEHDYYAGLTPEERLDILLELIARHAATFGLSQKSTIPAERRYRIVRRSRG